MISGLANDTEIVTETASWTQLTSAEQSLSARVEGLINDNLLMLGLSPEHDAVTIDEADSLTTSQQKEVSEALAALTVPTVVTEASTATVGGAPASAPCSDGACGRPLRGGVAISYLDSEEPKMNESCTAGYIATSKYNDLPYVLTAGHCVKSTVGNLWYSEVKEVPIKGTEEGPYSELGIHKIGKAHSYVFGESEEIPGGTTSEGDAGLIAIEPKGFWGSSLSPIIITYKSSETARNERYPLIGVGYNPEGSQSDFVVCVGGVGSDVEEGSTDGPRAECGLDEGFVSPHYEHFETPRHLEKLNACYGAHKNSLGKGNSGAPVYKNHLAYGIMSGIGGSCEVYYEGIDQAQKALHVNVLTGLGPVE